MAKKDTTGLIIGKFAPLHRGHRYLIDRALEKADRLIVLVYDVPELTRVPLEVRMDWVRRLYPQAEIIDAGIGPKEVGDSPDIRRLHTDHVKSKLPEGATIDYVFSSEDYGKYLASSLGAEDVLVDKERLAVPVSAGKIRSGVPDWRQYIEDFVYEDIMKYDK
jgi:HTH-type transcriptional repressor of NAD biosynthesis genes